MKQQFITDIISGSLDADLNQIISAVKLRQNYLNGIKLNTVKVGDRVKFKATTKPRYLAGVEATVKKVNQTRIVVDLDRQTNRFFRNVTVPSSIFEVVR